MATTGKLHSSTCIIYLLSMSLTKISVPMAKAPSKPGPPRRGVKQRVTPRKKPHVSTTYLRHFMTSKPWDLMEKKWPPAGSLRVSNSEAITSDTSMASSLVDLNTIYRFRLGGFTTVTSASNKFDAFVATDPSSAGVNFPEWTTLSDLFSEFRLVSFSVSFLAHTKATATVDAPLIVCGNLGTAIAPGSYAACADNADAKLYNAFNYSGMGPYTHTINGRSHDLNWSQVTTPTTAPYAGAPGSIQFFASAVANGLQLNLLVEGIYEFRSRV